MFFQILKRETRASHAKILLISLAEIPKILKSTIILYGFSFSNGAFLVMVHPVSNGAL